MTVSDVPEGFSVLKRGGAYFEAMGTVYIRPVDGECPVIALVVSPSHLNIAGITHGGMLATLVDSAMGMSLHDVRTKRGLGGPHVTVTLTIDYLASGRVGDWVEAHTRVRKLGRNLAFVDCTLRVGERELVSAHGVFSMKAPSKGGG